MISSTSPNAFWLFLLTGSFYLILSAVLLEFLLWLLFWYDGQMARLSMMASWDWPHMVRFDSLLFSIDTAVVLAKCNALSELQKIGNEKVLISKDWILRNSRVSLTHSFVMQSRQDV